MSDQLEHSPAFELASQTRGFQHDRSTDLATALQALSGSAVRLIPGSQYVGITMTGRDGRVETTAATDRYPVLLDKIAARHYEGPSLSAAGERRTVRVDDLAAEPRWPRFCRDALDETPVRSMLCFELFSDRTIDLALTFYAERPGAFDDQCVELGLVCATHIAIVWDMLTREQNFRTALASRDIIGQLGQPYDGTETRRRVGSLPRSRLFDGGLSTYRERAHTFAITFSANVSRLRILASRGSVSSPMM